MAVYWVTGKMRNGKGLFCSMMAKQFYCRGYRIAANYPMDTEIMHPGGVNPLTVLPMHPRPQDLWDLGRGCDENEKERFGALFLDEVGTWLNSTSNSKEYLEYYKWFVQSGKLGWDVYIQVQDESAVDTKIFKSTGELIVRCRRLDRIRIPVISDILEVCFPDKFGDTGKRKGLLPSLISAKVYIGVPRLNSRPNESRIFYAPSFYGIHPTNLVFDDGKELIGSGDGKRVCDMRAVYSLLPGKTLRQFNQFRQRMNKGAAVQSEPDYLAEERKEKRKGRRKKLVTGVVLVLFFWFWGRMALDFFSGASDDAPAPVPRADTQITASVRESVAPVATTVVLPVSQVWRLAGYMRDASGQSSFIVKNSNNVTRIVRSEQTYNGLLTVLELDGEQVTFYSGAGNNPVSSAPASSSGMGSLVTLATP
ncbi:Zonular occludens toxin (Zot) [Edwardsiella tarda]|nr:Zonular occludens toxin (Zot) [Edwardsiella tarda]